VIVVVIVTMTPADEEANVVVKIGQVTTVGPPRGYGGRTKIHGGSQGAEGSVPVH